MAVSTSSPHAEAMPRPKKAASRQVSMIGGAVEINTTDSIVVQETLPHRIRQPMRRPKDQLLKHRPPDIGAEDIARSVEAFMLDKPQLPPSMGKVDPILQAPKQIWYLRNKQLGEIGPLRGRLMQKRLDAGEVTIGSLVWRGDWDGWIPAESVFPSLVAEAERLRSKGKRSRAFKELPVELRRPAPRVKKKLTAAQKNQRKNLFFAAFVISGLIAILVLLVVAMKIVIDNP